MRTLVLILLVGAAASFVERDEWAAYKEAHGKTYANPIEEFYRMKVYADNKAYVEKHNAEHAAGKHTFTVELNKFADLTTEEWSATYKGLKRGSTRPHGTHKIIGTAAATKDWRDDGAVTGVKNQGQCGSCWSFSATGALEGAWKLAGHDLPSLSEQQLVDCSGNYGNQGCNGGWPDEAFRYIRDYGIATESGYPYYARQYQCQFTGGSDVTLSTWTDVAQYSEAGLEDAAGSVGPISVSIDASRRSFQLYSNGIYYEPNCSQTQLDHAVLVVGYGDNYWTVKNSWGTGWGQEGYIFMSKGSNNCGIASEASYPSV